jgi:hypothetical protein
LLFTVGSFTGSSGIKRIKRWYNLYCHWHDAARKT